MGRAATTFDLHPRSMGKRLWSHPGATLVRVYLRFQRSSRRVPSLNLHPSGARKHSKINDMPDTWERVLVGGPGVESHRETPTAGIALLLFAAPRPAPRSSRILVNHFPDAREDPATPCAGCCSLPVGIVGDGFSRERVSARRFRSCRHGREIYSTMETRNNDPSVIFLLLMQ